MISLKRCVTWGRGLKLHLDSQTVGEGPPSGSERYQDHVRKFVLSLSAGSLKQIYAAGGARATIIEGRGTCLAEAGSPLGTGRGVVFAAQHHGLQLLSGRGQEERAVLCSVQDTSDSL